MGKRVSFLVDSSNVRSGGAGAPKPSKGRRTYPISLFERLVSTVELVYSLHELAVNVQATVVSDSALQEVARPLAELVPRARSREQTREDVHIAFGEDVNQCLTEYCICDQDLLNERVVGGWSGRGTTASCWSAFRPSSAVIAAATPAAAPAPLDSSVLQSPPVATTHLVLQPFRINRRLLDLSL